VRTGSLHLAKRMKPKRARTWRGPGLSAGAARARAKTNLTNARRHVPMSVAGARAKTA
jgi:hypothetical protein